jgi:hypothetical protein
MALSAGSLRAQRMARNDARAVARPGTAAHGSRRPAVALRRRAGARVEATISPEFSAAERRMYDVLKRPSTAGDSSSGSDASEAK